MSLKCVLYLALLCDNVSKCLAHILLQKLSTFYQMAAHVLVMKYLLNYKIIIIMNLWTVKISISFTKRDTEHSCV